MLLVVGSFLLYSLMLSLGNGSRAQPWLKLSSLNKVNGLNPGESVHFSDSRSSRLL